MGELVVYVKCTTLPIVVLCLLIGQNEIQLLLKLVYSYFSFLLYIQNQNSLSLILKKEVALKLFVAN